MTNDEAREARLTAYALGDPSLDAAARADFELQLAADPALRAEVDATKAVAALLAGELAAEPQPLPSDRLPLAVSAPPAAPHRAKAYRWATALGLLAAVGVAGWQFWPRTVGENRAAANYKRSVATQLASAASPDVPPLLSITPKAWQELAQRGASDPQATPATDSKHSVLVTEHELNLGIPSEYLKRPASPAPASGPALLNFAMPAGGSGGGLGEPARDLDAVKATQIDGFAVVDAEKLRQHALGFQGQEALALAQTEPGNTNKFQALDENPFVAVQGQDALSTFGVDVDTASYSMVRRFLTQNQLPPPGAVRLEEIVNYFPYRDAPPDGAEPFAVRVEIAECPWQPKHRLVRLGLKAKPIANDKRPPSNLVFLIDVSGSMNVPDRLPLVKASLKLLVDELGENDRVAMVVYAGSSGLVLDSTSAAKKTDILYALDRLEAGGSTNGAGGIRQAYEVAVKNFIKGGTNRVILCTDGDWNVGTTSTDELMKLIEEKRQTGVFLSVLGFGMGNLRDEMMVNLAGKGNGNYAYIDSLKEAKKALVEQMGGTLVTVAKDVKIQVEFNPKVVGAYRLLGYEKRKLAAADFHNDKKDAGEMGAGHVVTALYELVPAGLPTPGSPKVDPLRYQAAATPDKQAPTEAFVVKLRHKAPDSEVSTLREIPVADNLQPYAKASEDFRFAAAAASFAQLLRNSPHKGNATYAAVAELAEAAKTHDPGGYRAEFVKLVQQAKALAKQP